MEVNTITYIVYWHVKQLTEYLLDAWDKMFQIIWNVLFLFSNQTSDIYL